MAMNLYSAYPINEFGSFVAYERTAQELKQTELAERVGVASSSINKIEKGVSNPSLAMMEDIMNALGFDLYFAKKEKHKGRDTCKQRRKIDREDSFKIGLALNRIAMLVPIKSLDKIKPDLEFIEETVRKYTED